MKDFYHLFEEGIQEMFTVEREIIKALPELIHAVKEPKLKEALREHLEETKNQGSRLEEIAGELEIDLKETPSPVMHALLQKACKYATSGFPHEVKDVAIILAVQCVEHYEIAVYGALKSFACLLKLDFIEKKLAETLEEEEKADKILTQIAEGTLFTRGINEKACNQKQA